MMEKFNLYSKSDKVNKFFLKLDSGIPLKCTSIIDQKFYYCYTLFIQQKNTNYKRGYLQKSIMIISEFYYKKLFLDYLYQFRNIFINETSAKFSLNKLEKLYEIYNNSCMENELSKFTSLEKENSLEFNTNSLEKIQSEIKQLNINYEISIYPQNNNFFENLSLYYVSKIWNLWELIITETPLLIQADTNYACSEIVFLLSSLIFPLKYCGDVRPYFTIYDKDFQDYREDAKLKDSNSPILGIINPICAKTFSDWPILHFDSLYFQENNLENPFDNRNIFTFTEETLSIKNYKRKFILSPNKALIKTFTDYIEEGNNKSLDKLNIYLRMYLIELNNDFMRTFEEYFFIEELMTLKHLVYIKPNLSIFEIFDKKKFLKYLENKNYYFSLKYVKDKKKTTELYSLFINTKCFNFYLKNLLNRLKSIDT